MNINDVIVKPIITEKSARLMGQNVYVFKIHHLATKLDVKRAVELIFAQSQAKVEKVNISNVKPQAKKVGQYAGFKSKYKKALVFLKDGSIPIYGETKEKDTTKKKKGLNIINMDKIMKQDKYVEKKDKEKQLLKEEKKKSKNNEK